MRASRITLAAAAVGGGLLARRSLHRLFSSWETNYDATDGHPKSIPDGRGIGVTASDGAQLRGIEFGDRSAPTVMLVHCWTGSVLTWGPVIHRLVDDGYHVVAVNQRGHDDSDRGTAPYRPETLGRDVAAWITELDLRDIVLAGHSMGGLASMAFAVEAPELADDRVAGLVLIATLAAPPRAPGMPESFRIDLGRLLPMAERSLRAGNYGLLGLLGIFGRYPAQSHLSAARDGFLDTDPRTRAEAATMMSAFDLRAGLGTISIPTRVVAGSHDRLTHLSMNEEIAELIPGAQLDVVSSKGHMLPWEAPDRVTDHIVAAAKAIGSAAP